jgi:hypothetical protein
MWYAEKRRVFGIDVEWGLLYAFSDLQHVYFHICFLQNVCSCCSCVPLFRFCAGGQVLIVGCIMQGFVARPESGTDGALNLMVWQCTLPGKAGVCLNLILNFVCYTSMCSTESSCEVYTVSLQKRKIGEKKSASAMKSPLCFLIASYDWVFLLLIKIGTKTQVTDFVMIVCPNFLEQIVVHLSTPTIRGWWSLCEVMAASHFHLGWRLGTR